tara:strand:- start:1346 stop:1843 length:498 start_codon:yes stop_codon:yes gene_type:complete
MTTSNSKLQLKIGSFEVSFEGDLQDLRSALPELIKTVNSELPKDAIVTVGEVLEDSIIASTSIKTANSNLNETTSSIATKMGVKSGKELITAAVVHLAVVEKREQFSRRDIIEQMRTTSFFKQTYVNNMTKSLVGLIKDKVLLERSKDVFSLNPNKIDSLVQRIA